MLGTGTRWIVGELTLKASDQTGDGPGIQRRTSAEFHVRPNDCAERAGCQRKMQALYRSRPRSSEVLDGSFKGFDRNELRALGKSPPFASDNRSSQELPVFILRVAVGGHDSVPIVGEALRLDRSPDVRSFVEEIDIDGRKEHAETLQLPSNV